MPRIVKNAEHIDAIRKNSTQFCKGEQPEPDDFVHFHSDHLGKTGTTAESQQNAL